jgi:hypothetical protein
MPGNPVFCPKCGASNDCITQTPRPDSALPGRVYIDPNGTSGSSPPASDVTSPLWMFGWMFLIAGIAVVIFAFSFDVSVSTEALGEFSVSIPSRVANSDRMGVREMICMAGCTLFIVGALFLALAPIHRSLLLQQERNLNAAPGDTNI